MNNSNCKYLVGRRNGRFRVIACLDEHNRLSDGQSIRDYLADKSDRYERTDVVDDAGLDALLEQWYQEAYLKAGCSTVSQEKFDDMLDILPPKRFETVDGVTRFLMCEHIEGPITEQYAQYKGRCLAKKVNAADPSTFITRADFAA